MAKNRGFMQTFYTRGFGWQRDLPDHRDYSPRHPEVVNLLDTLGNSRRKPALEDLPKEVELRDLCGPVEDQLNLGSSCAHACIGLLQYFERVALGRNSRLSRLFLYQAARRLVNASGDLGTDLRTTLKALVRFGLPPEKIWPYDVQRLEDVPDPFTLAYAPDYRSIVYTRLGGVNDEPAEILDEVRSFLAAGFPSVFGFSVFGSISEDADIVFPSPEDEAIAGQAVVAVGYDDRRRIRSDKGALLIRNSWGRKWGEEGYGWLPYRYVLSNLAADFWTILDARWLGSGEFRLPANEPGERS